MKSENPVSGGLLRPVLLVAATYVYFLLFAEFSLLQLAAPFGVRENHAILTALGVGGILGSMLAGRAFGVSTAWRQLQLGFAGCALSALAAAAGRQHWPVLALSAFATGLSLGSVTVTLATFLSAITRDGRLGLTCGLGTGLAYGFCNLPVVFATTAGTQNGIALGAALVGAGLAGVKTEPASSAARPAAGSDRWQTFRWLVIFLVLVGLDSAAFNLIQTTASLKAAMWTGSSALWGNAAVHLGVAVLAGIALDRGWLRPTVAVGAGLLLGACMLVSRHSLSAEALVRSLYVAGVSVYSVALVFYPASQGRPGLTALVYGLAGWLGSAVGIGLTQTVHAVPLPAVGMAAALIGGALLWRQRDVGWWLLVGGLAGGALWSGVAGAATVPTRDLVVRGREVFISEGCIHCHSSYVRPRVAADVIRWGPASSLAELAGQTPPLPGNRRQGPDLAQVGNRRSPEWQRLHLRDPRALTPASRMPAYAHLFAEGDGRGEALVAYLTSLGAETRVERVRLVADWQPVVGATLPRVAAQRLFQSLCAGCHGEQGRGDGPLAGQLSVRPSDFSRERWRYVPPGNPRESLARIIKFGLMNTPMAGHEWLDDDRILALAGYVEELHGTEAKR